MTSLADLLFEPPADATPDAVLVHAGDKQVTREQLTADALAVRDALVDAGVPVCAAIPVAGPSGRSRP